MRELFTNLVYDPLYNGLILFIDFVPGGDVGLAVILLTVLVKLVLLPVSIKAVKTQMAMRELEKPLKELQEKHKDDRQKQAEAVMALYREKGVNPFSSIALIFIQLPIIFGLYWVFANGGLPTVDIERLYSFVPNPDSFINMQFLGFVDMAGKSVVLAFLAGLTQFYQAKLSLPAPTPRKEGEEPDFKADFARSMHLQMRYVLPVVIAVVAYIISAAVALYWVTSNIVTISQELYVRRHVKKPVTTTE